MKILRKRRSSPADDLPDVETLLSVAIMEREQRRSTAEGAPAEAGEGTGTAARPPAEPSDDHRARAQAMLYDFAMRSFSAQVENIRRDAVISHLQERTRDGLRLRRLLAVNALGAALGYGLIQLAVWWFARTGLTVDQVVELMRQKAILIRNWAGV